MSVREGAAHMAAQAIYLNSAARSRADRRVVSAPITPRQVWARYKAVCPPQFWRWHFLDRQQTEIARLMSPAQAVTSLRPSDCARLEGYVPLHDSLNQTSYLRPASPAPR